MTQPSHTLPRRSPEIVLGLERIRRALRLTQREVTERMGVERATWSRVVNDRSRYGNFARPNFDTVAAMADAVGMALVLVPVAQEAPESAPAMRAVPVTLGRDYQPRKGHEPAPEPGTPSRSVMAWLRQARRAAGVNLDAMAERIGVGEHRLSAMEHGKREPHFGDVARYAQELGQSVAFMDPAVAPFAELDESEARAVRRLVVSYVDHAIRAGKSVPPGLMDAAEKLDENPVTTMDNAA